MEKNKKIDKSIIYYVLGGAALGAVAGYVVNKVGVKNIITVLKAKKIIPENIMNTITEFTNAGKQDDLDYNEDAEEDDRG